MSDDPPRISNEPPPGVGGALSELLRLQTDFHARLTDEVLRYLRGLQGALSPATPGTVVRVLGGLRLSARAAAGQTVELRVRLENVQRVHCLATAALSPLVAADGTTWYPETSPAMISRLIAPDEVALLAIPVRVPAEMPVGSYRGALHLQGFRGEAVPVELIVAAAAEDGSLSGAPPLSGATP